MSSNTHTINPSADSAAPATIPAPSYSPDPELQNIMRNIETKAENQVAYLRQHHPGQINKRTLGAIIQSGADEFEAKTGRPMTYSEMRAMFG